MTPCSFFTQCVNCFRKRSFERISEKKNSISIPVLSSSCPELETIPIITEVEPATISSQNPFISSNRWHRVANRIPKPCIQRTPKPIPVGGFVPERVQSLSSLQWGQLDLERTRWRSRSVGKDQKPRRVQVPAKQRKKIFNHKKCKSQTRAVSSTLFRATGNNGE